MALLLEGTNQPLCDLVKRRQWTAVTFQWPEVCTTYYRREFAFPASRASVGPTPQAENPTQHRVWPGKNLYNVKYGRGPRTLAATGFLMHRTFQEQPASWNAGTALSVCSRFKLLLRSPLKEETCCLRSDHYLREWGYTSSIFTTEKNCPPYLLSVWTNKLPCDKCMIIKSEGPLEDGLSNLLSIKITRRTYLRPVLGLGSSSSRVGSIIFIHYTFPGGADDTVVRHRALGSTGLRYGVGTASGSH